MKKVNKIPLLFISALILLTSSTSATAQSPADAAGGAVAEQPAARRDGISLSPARFELEMSPGSETTVVVNLDYQTARADAKPSRIVASLNDWDIARSGELEFFKAGSKPNSASPWIIYSPTEVTVMPGNTHSIRVTITVPREATPGDHLAALIIEQRPENIKQAQNSRQMTLRFRMAAMFYVKVPQVTRRGSLENLKAAHGANGITVTPTLKNAGNSVIRPVSSIKVMAPDGRTVAERPESETMPVLGGSEMSLPVVIEKTLSPGTYTVKYRVDFQDGSKITEGLIDLVVK